jgi:tetratricopeptide (TPR) repeat protein
MIFYSNGRFVVMDGVDDPDKWQEECTIDVGIWHIERNKVIMRSGFKHIYHESYGFEKENGLLLLCFYPGNNTSICFRRKKDPMSYSDATNRKKNAIAAARRGHKYLKSGDDNQAIVDYDSACIEFTRAILLDDKNANAHYGRGRAYLRLGNNKQAIMDFDEAIRLNPKDAISLSNRGRAYARMGDYERAIADFQEAAEIDPKNELIKQNLERARRHEEGL